MNYDVYISAHDSFCINRLRHKNYHFIQYKYVILLGIIVQLVLQQIMFQFKGFQVLIITDNFFRKLFNSIINFFMTLFNTQIL